MQRLWICGICQNNAQELREILVPLRDHLLREDHPYHLGTIWVDGGSDDNNETMLAIASQHGIMLCRKWTNDHDFQMNQYMRSGHIKHGDWVIQLDTSERLHPEFIDKLQNGMLANFEAQGINTVYQRSKPLLFKYRDDQVFSGSPHWGIAGQRHHMVDISKFDGFDDDKTYCWSLRDDINKWIVNGIKYYYVYGRSNHMWLIYSPANYPGEQNIIQEHEITRHKFRDYCRDTLQLSMDNTHDLTEFMRGPLPAEFIEFMNYEKVVANYYRYIHGEDQQIIYDTQNEWKYAL